MSYRSWTIDGSPVYALSVGSAQANAQQPTGFASGGVEATVYNSGATDVLVYFYKFSSLPTLTFPVTGAPPVGEAGIVVPKGARVEVRIPANADSFSAIGSAAGPSIIYVQRGKRESSR